ncbi:MAG: SprB repeat-containing protein [Paludibacteraceae bacterium]
MTDSEGIAYSTSYVIVEPLKLILANVSKKDITCYGVGNGSISLTVSGGTAPYEYTWTKDGQFFSNDEDLHDLLSGEYSVIVTDTYHCAPQAASFTIVEPTPILVKLSEKQDLKCFGDSVGYITVEVTGGTPKTSGTTYEYRWAGPNGFTSNSKDISSLKSGNYKLTVTDGMGCTQGLDVTITQPDKIKIDITKKPVTCYGANDASIQIVVTGGMAPYQIEWSNLVKGTYLENLGPGVYVVKITDANACVSSESITIDETPFSIHPVIKDVSCFGAQDGSIALNVVGGAPPVMLVWDDDAVAGSTRNRLKPGTYTVSLSDATCSFSKTFTILEPLAINVAATVTHAFDCDNPNSGSVRLVVSGGTAPYKFQWSNGSTSQNQINIPAGTYIVNITDDNGCTFSKKYEVKRQQPLELSVNIAARL